MPKQPASIILATISLDHPRDCGLRAGAAAEELGKARAVPVASTLVLKRNAICSSV